MSVAARSVPGRTALLSYCFPPTRVPRSVQVARLALHMRRPAEVWAAPVEGPPDPTLPDVSTIDTRVVPWPRGAPELLRLRRKLLDERLEIPDYARAWARAAGRALIRSGLTPSDVLVTFGQPMSDHLAGWSVARATGVTWVAHFSDPWADNPLRAGGPIRRAADRHHERRVVTTADHLVFTCEEARDLVMAKYPDRLRERTSVLAHAHGAVGALPIRKRSESLVARYLGNFYGDRGPEPLLAALAVLHADRPDLAGRLRVELIGGWDRRPEAGLDGLPDGAVVVRSPVDYGTSLRLMAEADVLLVVDAAGASSPFLPSKLADYVGVARPVVALSPPGPAARVVAALGGWVADPSDAAAGGLALAAALDASADPGPWGSPAVRDEFAAAQVAGRFEAILDLAAAQRPGLGHAPR